ncbi:CoA transferase [Agromyces rhizosphaerae]|uniref:CoA transferase n=1 Tax=Agromyces rhizosphaerae TaxID=88374 RepID=A0A9W6CW35_9MICO|nr:CoA transferase [Agromyces rhizosphaerae]GLI26765.1 CoA transferase [Agromyces rhizosphaerae]
MTDRAPLRGIRVADFSRVLAGPYATMLLADFGADVVKVESPEGDGTRQWSPPVDARGDATYFAAVNRNKRSVVCDLATPQGRARAWELATTADVVVENLRPGAMASFGLGVDALRAANPRLVTCSITGFGSGAGAALPGYDLLAQAMGGLMSVTGPADGEPAKAGVALVDVLAGMNAVTGILLALRARDDLDGDGLGRHVEVDLLTGLLSALTNQAAGTLATGTPPARTGNAHPSIAPYALFRTADRPLVLAVGTDRQFRTLARLIGAPGLADDPRFAANPDRVAHRDALTAALEERLAAASAAHWTDVLTDAGVPAGPVHDIAEAFALAERLGLPSVVELGGGDGLPPSRSVANPIRLDRGGADYRLPPPRLGEHADAAWLDRPTDPEGPTS